MAALGSAGNKAGKFVNPGEFVASSDETTGQIYPLSDDNKQKVQSTMNSTERAELMQRIGKLGVTRGKVIKSRGVWVIVPSIQRAKRIPVPAPIVNLPPAQWGDGDPIVIEGKR